MFWSLTLATNGIPTAGQAYSLNYCLTGITVIVTDTVSYQWFKGQDSYGTHLTNTSELQFSSLRASDAGSYTCWAMVRSVEMEGTTTMSVNRKCSIQA